MKAPGLILRQRTSSGRGRDHKFNWMGAAIQLARKCHERASHGGADMPQPNSKVFELKGPKASKRSSDSRKQQSTSAGTHEGTLGDAWRRVGKIHEGTLVENRCHVQERVEALQQKVTCYVHLVRRHEQQSTLTGTHEGTLVDAWGQTWRVAGTQI